MISRKACPARQIDQRPLPGENALAILLPHISIVRHRDSVRSLFEIGDSESPIPLCYDNRDRESRLRWWYRWEAVRRHAGLAAAFLETASIRYR